MFALPRALHSLTPLHPCPRQVDSYPTFKFYHNAAEDALPVVGASIDEVDERIKYFLGGSA